MAFDSPRLIFEIKNRPPLWDNTIEDYTNRELKKKLWREVVNLFGGEELKKEKDKKELGISLQRKWKNLRDSFAREIRYLRKSDNELGPNRKSPYIYYKQMLFLKKTVSNSTTDSQAAEFSSSPRASSPHASLPHASLPYASSPHASLPHASLPYASSPRASLPRTYNKSHLNHINKKKKSDANDESKELINTLCKSIQRREELDKISDADEDRMFLLSLLPELKKISEDLKFSTKMEIMSVIQKAKLSSGYNSKARSYCQLTSVNSKYLGTSSYENMPAEQLQTCRVSEVEESEAESIPVQIENSDTVTTLKEEILDFY